MSSKFPMVSLDKVEVKLTVKNWCIVAADKVAAGAGVSRAALFNAYIEDGLKRAKVKMTATDIAKVDAMRAENLARREAKKQKKGSR